MNNHFHAILHHEAESQNPGMMSTLGGRLSTGTKRYTERGELKMDRSVNLPLTFHFSPTSAVGSANLEISRSDHFCEIEVAA